MDEIFVISLPRSGSTWVSRALAAALRTHVINEPFNWRKHPDREKYHMRYLTAGMPDDGLGMLLPRILHHPLSLATALVGRRCQVVKDVHACLAVEQIWERVRPKFIFLIRHPCAVAQSWARLQYEVDFRLVRLISQDKLLEEHLAPFVSQLTRREDYYYQVGAFWGASYYVMNRISARHPDWVWATHEELCNHSEERFTGLAGRLGYPPGRLGRWLLRRYIQQNDRPRRPGERIYSVKRQSTEEPGKWKTQLTEEQIRAVLDGAGPFGLLDRFFG